MYLDRICVRGAREERMWISPYNYVVLGEILKQIEQVYRKKTDFMTFHNDMRFLYRNIAEKLIEKTYHVGVQILMLVGVRTTSSDATVSFNGISDETLERVVTFLNNQSGIQGGLTVSGLLRLNRSRLTIEGNDPLSELAWCINQICDDASYSHTSLEVLNGDLYVRDRLLVRLASDKAKATFANNDRIAARDFNHLTDLCKPHDVIGPIIYSGRLKDGNYGIRTPKGTILYTL